MASLFPEDGSAADAWRTPLMLMSIISSNLDAQIGKKRNCMTPGAEENVQLAYRHASLTSADSRRLVARCGPVSRSRLHSDAGRESLEAFDPRAPSTTFAPHSQEKRGRLPNSAACAG